MVKRRRSTCRVILQIPPEKLDNLKSMIGFIKERARETVVVIDNNVIPYVNRVQLPEMSNAAIYAFAEFNNSLANIMRDFSSDKVIITKDVSEEIKTGVYASNDGH